MCGAVAGDVPRRYQPRGGRWARGPFWSFGGTASVSLALRHTASNNTNHLRKEPLRSSFAKAPVAMASTKDALSAFIEAAPPGEVSRSPLRLILLP
jgi:hypothetical protein